VVNVKQGVYNKTMKGQGLLPANLINGEQGQIVIKQSSSFNLE
jgi:hypothetical protein